MRHGGVSHDLMHRLRTVDEAKRRGRWRTDTSLRRYGKETRILSELRKVDARVLAFGELVAHHLADLLAGRMAPLPVPFV